MDRDEIERVVQIARPQIEGAFRDGAEAMLKMVLGSIRGVAEQDIFSDETRQTLRVLAASLEQQGVPSGPATPPA